MKRYDTYKDSGVQWIGEIPSHWQVCAFKRNIVINNGSDYKEYLDEEIYPVMGSGGCFAYCSRYLYDGEAVLLGRKGTIDKPLYFNGKFWAVDTMFYAVPKKSLHCRFAYYLALTFPFSYYSTSTALPSMTQSDLGNNPVVFPPLEEQETIAAWLDVKCGEIDKLIATQQRRIELLQELRQSIITRAVTHGINPDAPMRSSGIDWIGDIPAHWESKRLRFVCELRNGYTPSKANPDFWTDGTIPWYRMEDIRESGRRLNEAKQYITEEAVKGGGLFEAGSFILATTATIGEHAVLIVDSLANQQFTNLKIRKSLTQSVMTDYFFYYLFVIDEYCKTTTRTATFPAVNMEDLKNFLIVYPSPAEQQEIVDYIERETAKVDSAIGKAERQIALLQELRQSVITEVVTGKRKVC